VPLGGRVLAPRRPALPPESGSCHCASRWHGLNDVGYAAGDYRHGYDARCTFLENFDPTIYFSKIVTK
jgi:hypothetical protein